MSGSGFSDWATSDSTYSNTIHITRTLHCETSEEPYRNLQLITKCLREATTEQIMSVRVPPSIYKPAFGPTVDGVTINRENIENKEKVKAALAGYKIMFGVTSAESAVAFSEHQLRSGITEDVRDGILWRYITSVNKYHNKEIFASIISEYTEWNKPLQHPINLRDDTIAALTDGQYVAPILRLAQFMPQMGYFYVFHYKKSDGYDYQVGQNLKFYRNRIS